MERREYGMEYQGEVMNSIYGERRVRNGVSRRSVE